MAMPLMCCARSIAQARARSELSEPSTGTRNLRIADNSAQKKTGRRSRVGLLLQEVSLLARRLAAPAFYEHRAGRRHHVFCKHPVADVMFARHLHPPAVSVL